MHISPTDLDSAKYSNFLDDFDMVMSPFGGHLVVVAMKNGVHVCWQCGEQYDPNDHKLAMVEKRTPGATVPCGVHRKCVAGPSTRKSFHVIAKGLQVRRAVADIVKKTAGLLK